MITSHHKTSLPVKHRSLGRRFSIVLSCVVICILLIFSLGVVLFNYFKIQKQLDEQLTDTLKLAETSLPTAVWQMDYSSMDDILGAILINDVIASVRISTENVVAVEKMQPQYEGLEFAFFIRNTNKFNIKSVDVIRSGEKVGVFEVVIVRAEIKRGLFVTVVGVISLALCLCVAILVTSVIITRQYVFKPLIKLENHARMIAEGDLETNIEISGDDEFTQLASAFNIMANRLKISFDTLEQKVKERTVDLYQAKNAAEKMNQHLGIVGAELEALLDNSPVGIIFVDFNRIIHRVNPEIVRITGYSKEDLVGFTTRKLYTSQEVYESLGKTNYGILRREGLCQSNIEILTKSGEKIMCNMRGRVVAAKGGLEGVIWSLEDISKRLKMEEEILKVEKLESIGVLAGGIAHDFNNILLAIIGNISLAKRVAEEDSKVCELLDSAERASLRARDLTVKLLTFASGGEPVRMTESLPELLKESVSFVLSGSNVKCVFNISKDLWPVSMDKAQISQVIQNLVVNADHSMPNGGNMTISCENIQIFPEQVVGLKDSRYVRVIVQDNGAGISKEHIGRVFDPYFSTKARDSNKGSGLGLSIVHAIITKHGGKIQVESCPGEGSTFTIYLPAMSDNEIAPVESKEITDGCKGRILIMDDEESIRHVVGEMLNQLGYETEQSCDGDEAIAVYQEHYSRGESFDAVIMDLTIPGGMGGAEAVKKLRAFDPKAKVIVSSGYSRDPILDHYQQFGFNNIISKPYRMNGLALVLSETLSA